MKNSLEITNFIDFLYTSNLQMNQSSKRRYMLAQNHTGLTVFLNKSFTPKEESFKFYLEIADQIHVESGSDSEKND